MSGYVFINGELIPAEEAKISVYDHGFLYGDGLFETMRSYKGKVFREEEHLARLFAASGELGIKLPDSLDLSANIKQTLEKNGLSDKQGYIRLSATRGEGPIGIDPALCNKPNVIIMTKEVNINIDIYNKGIDAVIVKTIRNSVESTDPRLKTMNFLNNIMAKMEVKKAGAAEGIFINHKGEVAEATTSNIFLIKTGKLITPPIETGILPGVTRKVILTLASEIMPVVEEKLYPEDLYNADEIFLTNSISEVIPVINIDNNVIGTGKPGEVTKRLHAKYIAQTCL